MAFKIITADERLKDDNGIKGVIFGPAKIGKTSLLWTLNPETTLFVDLEAGGLSVRGWGGDSIEVRDWDMARNIACYLCGPDPSKRADQAYSQAHYDHVTKEFGSADMLNKYKTIFVDSITVAGRLCFQWCGGQDAAKSEKTGKHNLMGQYGIHGQEMISWLTQLQHIKQKNIWLVGLLDEKVDDYNRKTYVPQIEGSKAGLELPGIVDQVVSMVSMSFEGSEAPQRVFVCQQNNKWGYPAGDRSTKLNLLEEPHLGKLMNKINGPIDNIKDKLEYNQPKN